MNKVFDKIYKCRFIIAIVLLIILVAFKLNGSSTGYWNTSLYKDPDEGVIFGHSRLIRYDEFVVNTMMAFSQYENDFGFTSNLLRGSVITNMFLVYGQPVKDIAILFRLFLVGYLFLSPERGLSFFWWSRMFALFLASFEFALLITNKNKKLSFAIGILVGFAPVIHWWFAVNNFVEMIVFAELAIVLIDKYFNEDKFWKRVLLSSVVMICAGNYIFCTYPAWLIPVTYIFLPALVWVFYKNRKNIKLTKKDIFVLGIELAILVGLVLRIFIKSKDALDIILNTAYPGKRLNFSGDLNCLKELITNSVNFFLPYTTRIYNPCEIATFVDFAPITIVLLLITIFKNKTKDFLLYFMLGISIFLNVYCIFGFPAWLAKITFLSYSLANRVKGVVGLINIFILARVLTLEKENSIGVKISIIISVLLSSLIGIYIKVLYPTEFLPWQYFVMSGFTGIIYFLILQAKDKTYENILVFAIAVFSIISVLKVNPLRIGTTIFESELGQTIKQINEEEPGTWVISGINGNFLIPFGVNCFNCVNIYPNLPLWYEIDSNREYEEIYNRYANVLVELVNEDRVWFSLAAPDTFHVFCNLDNLYKINIRYFCSRESIGRGQYDTNNYKLTRIDKKERIYIYKIEPVGE